MFCRLLAGDGPASWIQRGETASALLPRHATWPGHTLVISNEHAVGVHDASPEALQGVALLIQQLAQRLTDALGSTGVNVLNASGAGSGQSVDHLHFHVVPRWPEDGMDLWPHGQESTRTLDDTWAEQVRAGLAGGGAAEPHQATRLGG